PVFVTAMLVLIGVGFSIGNYLGGNVCAGRSLSSPTSSLAIVLIPMVGAVRFTVTVRLASSLLSSGAMAAVIGFQSPYNDQRSVIALL
ncbi:hypothetical protein O5559_27685, partial [Escherichia coli]|nr:hypothetical protein [Escherichia coli]